MRPPAAHSSSRPISRPVARRADRRWRASRRPLVAVALVGAAVVVALAGATPVAAQYSDPERGFAVDPVRVPAGGDLSGTGFGCSGGGPVIITIDGVPGVFAIVIAHDDSTYSVVGRPIPETLTVGDTYTAIASCDGVAETANFTVICASGDEPDALGRCPVPPTTTTTTMPSTTMPGSSTTTLVPATTAPPTDLDGDGPSDEAGDGSGGGTSGGPDLSDALAFTGAGPLPLLKLAATLATAGVLLVVGGRRRPRDHEPAQAI